MPESTTRTSILETGLLKRSSRSCRRLITYSATPRSGRSMIRWDTTQRTFSHPPAIQPPPVSTSPASISESLEDLVLAKSSPTSFARGGELRVLRKRGRISTTMCIFRSWMRFTGDPCALVCSVEKPVSSAPGAVNHAAGILNHARPAAERGKLTDPAASFNSPPTAKPAAAPGGEL